MWIQDPINLVLGMVVCEALVNLFFNATILQPTREFLIKVTPFLTVREDHLFDCKMCVSFWLGLITVGIMCFSDYFIVKFFIYGIVFHRLSNYWHLIYSITRDRQMDIRVNRNKKST